MASRTGGWNRDRLKRVSIFIKIGIDEKREKNVFRLVARDIEQEQVLHLEHAGLVDAEADVGRVLACFQYARLKLDLIQYLR